MAEIEDKKKEVAPLEKVPGQSGPATIFCDPNLESSLQFETNQDHYIGRLEGEDGIFSSPYLPVRLQPAEEDLERGWDEPDFGVLDNDGDIVTEAEDKSQVGIKVPLGLEITVTEIVQSKTGTWVGFIALDPRADDLDDVFADNTRTLYTKAEYVRIKKDSVPGNTDPYLSERVAKGDFLAESTSGVAGAATIAPGENENWVKLEPEDVKFQYFNFYFYNQSLADRGQIPNDDGRIIYDLESIDNFQSLRYSEGYFYFIVGSAPRKTEAEIINSSEQGYDLFEDELEEKKIAEKIVTHDEIKNTAWDNLLEYLGRSEASAKKQYIENLKDKYFVQVARKTNTQTPDPSNEKILFAIRAEYIDSLPRNPRLFKNNFKDSSTFLRGNNYAVSFPVSEIKKRCETITKTLKDLKSKIDASKLSIENANESEYDMQAQIKFMEEVPEIFKEFLGRQSFPLSSNKSRIYELIRGGGGTSGGSEVTNDNLSALDFNVGSDLPAEHFIQLGIKDNGEIAGNARETISYVLFSPGPGSLVGADASDTQDLFYFDPFITQDDIDFSDVPRSALSLNIALPWLREKFEGVYGSRALHLLLSYEKSNKFFGASDTEENWMEYLSKYMVPPVRIHLSKQLRVDDEPLECDELIKKLNKAGPILTPEERLLQEQLYNNPDCMVAYYDKFSKATPAVSPGMSKRELEKKAKKTESGGNVLDNQYVKVLYTGFFNALDTNSITALIMACLQKKLGVALTAEAICETAIIKLVESTGAGSVEKAMLANALLAPDSESSQLFLKVYGDGPPFAPKSKGSRTGPSKNTVNEPGQLLPELDKSYNNAPIATSMLMSDRAPVLTLNLDPVEEEDSLRIKSAAIEAVKSLEKSGQTVNLIPAIKGYADNKYVEEKAWEDGTDVLKTTKKVALAAASFGKPIPVYYSQVEIDNERARLKTLGYTKAETDSVLVASGYLAPDPNQYEVVLGDGKVSSTPPGGQSGATGLQPYNYSAVEDARVVEQNAENWLNYMKRTIGLASICELIVGDVLDGLQSLIRDPGAFFNGGGAGWWDSFVEGLKRQFSPPVPTLKFPDSLATDNHMGDYGEKLLKTILAMVAQMLGQIVNLLLKNALEQCLEEDSDLGPAGRKPAPGPDVPFPAIEASNLPTIRGLSNADMVAWIKDILDNVSTGQLCALLRGDATRQTLRACVSRTKSNWIKIYNGGMDTIQDIESTFRKIGESIDLDICNVVESPTLVNNLCDAIFDRDARCSTLLEAGLTKEECEQQIDQEIQDLKSRVSGLASLSLLDTNPLENSFPPICGENGNFVVPPGVKDTMDRITDNILTNVKGSLMVDLEGLKFFSDPPRALKAVTDPEELKRAHSAFLKLAQKPNKKKCLAFIGDPLNHYSDNNIEQSTGYIIYPLTYNSVTPSGDSSILNSNLEELIPLHVGLLNEEDDSDLIAGSIAGKLNSSVKNDVSSYINSKLDAKKPEEIPSLLVNNELNSEYVKQIKIKNLDSLTVAQNQLFKGPLYKASTRSNTYKNFPGNQNTFYGSEISNFNLALLKTDASVYSSYKKQRSVLSRTWTLDTKLKDIDNRPQTWYYMLQAYTGVHLTISGDLSGAWPKRNFPMGGWITSYDFWLDEFDPEAPSELYAGTGFNPLAGAGTDWWWLYVYSPGLRNLVKIIKNLYEDFGKKPFKFKTKDGSEKEFNLAIAFMELTVAEATGLQYDVVQDKFPNISNYFDDSSEVIFGTYKNPTLSLVEPEQLTDLPNVWFPGNEGGPAKTSVALDESFKQTQRWGEYEFYYPHFLVFDKLFRDPKSSLNAPPQEIIEAFSNVGAKVNQDLYDSLSFIPESVMPASLRGEKVVTEDGFITYTDPSPDVQDVLVSDAEDIKKSGLYNPNILKYELPSKIVSAVATGGLTEEMQEAIGSINPEAQLSALADQLETTNIEKSLIYQNTITPLSENSNIQIDEVKNVSKLVKGVTTQFAETVFVEESIVTGDDESPYQIAEPMPGVIKLQTRAAPGMPYVDASKQVTANVLNKIDRILVDTVLDPFVVYNIEKLTAGPGILEQNVPESKQFLYNLVSNPESKQLVDIINPFRATDEQGGLSMRVTEPLELYSLFNEAISLIGDTEFEIIETSKVLPGDPPTPPYAIPADDRITNATYNFNFAGKLAPDVHDLIESLYPGDKSLSLSFQGDYSELYKDFDLEPDNYKAQIFSQLLSKKLDDKLQQYLPTNASFNDENLKEIKQFLAIEGFSALQYAYSTQMFAKMKASRLHNRGFMKKIWKKILKSPLVSEGIDPRCENVLEKIGAPTDTLSRDTETDFFKIEEIKPKIIELYEKSLCKDIYEANIDGQNSTRVSLLEGMVRLVVKVYTLEMCLASVIAWDSFDLEDVFKDTSMAAIILQSISEDFDIEFLSFFATDMLRKENNLTDIQLAELRLGVDGAPQSSMEYLIGLEAESISTVVKNMFVNSFPLSTDLRISLLKNSDPDYANDFSKEIINSNEYNNVDFIAEAGALTGSTGPLEVISDARMHDNIYTMNFGSGRKNPYVGIGGGINFDFDRSQADVFGLEAERGVRSQNNKNYLHSLPMNWYHDHAPYSYSDWKDKAWNLNSSNTLYTGEKINNLLYIQDNIFGRTDAFSLENSLETSHGNNLNRTFGNIIFEPYVKIEDWGPDEERNFKAEVYSNLDLNGEPCDQAVLIETFNIEDYLEIIDNKINIKRDEQNNAFKSHIYGNVPLSAWSYFYNSYFLKSVNESAALTALFNEFGFEPFFKKVSFGMRMSYITANPGLDKTSLIESLNVQSASTPLKNVKSILGQRPYYVEGGNEAVLYELQIPIVEVEKQISSINGSQSFVIENSELIPFSELGTGPDGNQEIYYTKNPHQFFYDKLANGMLQEIKNSAEFKLMYDYLFPMRRYMAMATIMASDGLSTFISNPTDVLDRTKQSLSSIIDNISNSTDFKHLPDPVANLLADRALRAEAGTGAKEPDMTKEILKIVLRTPLLVLKGFVEITDPAIITAKRIIDISNAVAVNTLAAVKQGIATAKRIVQSGIDAARQILQQLEMQLSIGIGFAKSAVATLPTIKTSAGSEKLSDYIIIDNSGDIESWVLETKPLPEDFTSDDPEMMEKWDSFNDEFDKLIELRQEYIDNKSKLSELEKKKAEIVKEGEEKVKEAEQRLKSVYQSPYLLPGVWSAMMPSVIPYGGGINPYPMPLPFVSTFPGMIYLAILFIDAMDEKLHDDIQNTKDPNCEDQL